LLVDTPHLVTINKLENDESGLIERYIEQGSTIELVCNSTAVSDTGGLGNVQSNAIQWYKVCFKARESDMCFN